VLLTGDDEARQRGAEQELRLRARQNVILELGFFVGALGRQRVVLLYEEGVELPSDISGVLYLPLDEAGAWKTRLAREMLEAGVRVDAEAVLRA
jgi:predicted nucleotide-binding protein